MTRPRLILLLLLGAIGSAAVGLDGCARYGDDIDAVKQADSIVPGKRNEILVLDMAGARGTVEWQGGPAPKYDSPDIVAVSAVIKRISGNGNRHQIELDFIHNRQTKQVAFDGALVDGKKQDLIGATINLFLMQLE